MSTAGPAHFAYLDGWRGLAISLLLIGHFFPVPGINLGTVGVNLFFVLSGLLMGRLLFLREVPLPQFYKRRIARIFPAFFVFVALVVAWYCLSSRPINWSEVASTAFFVRNYFMTVPELTLMPFDHTWSLSVEEHGYIVLSLLALLARRKLLSAWSGVLACLAAMACVGVAYRVMYEGRALGFHLAHSEFAGFGIVVSVLMVLYFSRRTLPSLHVIAWSALFLLSVLLHWWSVPVLVQGMAALALMALALHLLGASPSLAQRALEWYPLRQLGLWSYSLYLWQQPFYRAVHQHEISAPVGVVLGLLCGIASFYLVEQPARQYLNQRWDKASVAPAAVAEAA